MKTEDKKEMFHFSGPFCDESPVDLNDRSNYDFTDGSSWNTMPFYDLHRLVWKELGESLYYMQYFWPEIHRQYWDKSDDSDSKNCQYARVDKMCQWFADNRVRLHPDNDENRLELMKFLYKFQEEVENQC